MRRALIVGSEGQDGRILFDRLAAEGVSVAGIGRESLRGGNGAELRPARVDTLSEVRQVVDAWRPDEVYYLAAIHQSSQDPAPLDDASLFEKSLRIHVSGIVNFLTAMREIVPHSVAFYAASSLVFGEPSETPQNEATPLRPRCIYGITKAAGMEACRFFRDVHGLHVSVGVLYNHESMFRSANYLSKKIVGAAARIEKGSQEKLVVGDLSAQTDWGYAPDFVDAMVRMVRHDSPADYVVATGEPHTVKEFAEIAFRRVDLDWRDHVVENKALLSRRPITRIGDSSRLRRNTGWEPTVSFRRMVELLTDAERIGHAA